LMRYAGLVRTIGRMAIEDVDLNGCFVRSGEKVILRVIAGNRDPDQFTRANEVDIQRAFTNNLSLGMGAHSCVGAGLIRMAAASITRPLLETFSEATLTQPIEWSGGSGFRYPASLWAYLT
jgi:cytochrome P450